MTKATRVQMIYDFCEVEAKKRSVDADVIKAEYKAASDEVADTRKKAIQALSCVMVVGFGTIFSGGAISPVGLFITGAMIVTNAYLNIRENTSLGMLERGQADFTVMRQYNKNLKRAEAAPAPTV